MRSVIVIALIVAVAYADAEACVRQNCPKEVSACEKEVFGCALKALNCSNKCNNVPACNAECAQSSGNAKLIALNTCGKQFCSGVTSFEAIFGESCNTVECINKFSQQCVNETMLGGIECTLTFFQRNPECECVKYL